MTRKKLPKTDSIEELARFWDRHDVTDFEDQMEEVAEPVFELREGAGLRLALSPEQSRAIHRIARSKGIRDAELVHQWVSEKLVASRTRRAPRRRQSV